MGTQREVMDYIWLDTAEARLRLDEWLQAGCWARIKRPDPAGPEWALILAGPKPCWV